MREDPRRIVRAAVDSSKKAPTYYRARYYHPDLQRFIGEDPIGFLGRDANLYAYVTNNPIRFVDPLGLDYADFNLSGGAWGGGATGGVMQTEWCICGYVGGGAMTPGISGSLTKGYGTPITGWNFAFQVNVLIAFQLGWTPKGGFYSEWGGGLPFGAALTAFYVFQPICQPPTPSPKFPPPPPGHGGAATKSEG